MGMFSMETSRKVTKLFLKRGLTAAGAPAEISVGTAGVEAIEPLDEPILGPSLIVHYGKVGGTAVYELIPASNVCGLRVIEEETPDDVFPE